MGIEKRSRGQKKVHALRVMSCSLNFSTMFSIKFNILNKRCYLGKSHGVTKMDRVHPLRSINVQNVTVICQTDAGILCASYFFLKMMPGG